MIMQVSEALIYSGMSDTWRWAHGCSNAPLRSSGWLDVRLYLQGPSYAMCLPHGFYERLGLD